MRSLLFVICLTLLFVNSNAQEWTPVGVGIQSQFKDKHNYIYDLIVFEDILYAAGNFTEADGKTAMYIAKWDGNEWLPVGEGMNGPVSSLLIYRGELYAGGWFTKAGEIEVNYIAKWNGSIWSGVGAGLNGHPNDMIEYRGALYVGGEFTTAGGKAARNVAKWDGKSWTSAGKGLDVVRTLGVYKDALYTAGWAFDKGAHGINKWDGTKWTTPNFDITGVPTSMIVYKDELYFGGYFPADKKKSAENCLSQYNGSRLLITGTKGTNGDIDAMFVHNDVLYTAGFFTEVEGISTNNIAKWNGQSWTSFTPGVDFHPHAIVVYKDFVYAAGGYPPSQSGTVEKLMIARMPLLQFDAVNK